jgi:GNAT superfamily N-acetyltransferase
VILFSAVEADDCLAAYQWHRGFSGANDALYPRDHDSFQSMVMDGSVWAAKDPSGDFLALGYSTYDESQKICEIGGLMVAAQAQRKGLGSAIMRLTLAHTLVEENLLEIPDARIVAHVLRGNEAPRRIITETLRFKHVGEVTYPAHELPGLRAEEDGMVHGDEFELTKPDSIAALAQWTRDWPASLRENPAHVELRAGVTIEDWTRALEDLTTKHSA